MHIYIYQCNLSTTGSFQYIYISNFAEQKKKGICGQDSWRKALPSPTTIGLVIYQQHFLIRVAVQGYCILFRLAPDSQDLWFCQSAGFYLVYSVPLVLTVINTNYNFADKKKIIQEREKGSGSHNIYIEKGSR